MNSYARYGVINLTRVSLIVLYGRLMPQKEHTFTKFDDDLHAIRDHILEMGGMVEKQFKQSLTALFESNAAVAKQVIDQDYSVNQLEVMIDNLCVTAIARQQPAASDLQSIIISTKVVVHLERIGDEAKKIARIAERLSYQKRLRKQHPSSVHHAAEVAQHNLSAVMESYALLDTIAASKLLHSEDTTEEKFNIVFRALVQSMTDDPRTISSSLEILFVAKAIEHIENHIKHIAKLVIEASNRYSEI